MVSQDSAMDCNTADASTLSMSLMFSNSKTINEDSIKVSKQLARLEEINSMDLTLLSETEKQFLRDEILNIKQDRYDYEKGGGERLGHGEVYHSYHRAYYISVGFGLLILLLLIILL
jgi:hypothetical protein